MWGSIKTLALLFIILNTAIGTDYVNRLGADDREEVIESLPETSTGSAENDGLFAPTPVQDEGASAASATSPGDLAPRPSSFVHTIEVGLHKGSATHIGGGAFITCNHLRRNNPQNTTKIDGVQYGGMIYGLDDADLCLFLLDDVPNMQATKAVRRSLKEGEILTLVGKMTGTIQGTVRYDKKFNDGSVWLETPGTGVIPGDSGGGAFDSEGNLVAVIVADANESDHVFVVPLNLEKNRWPKHNSILQEQPMITTTESLIKGAGTETLLFTASWCGPCRVVKTTIVPNLEEAGHKITLIDIDQYRDLSVQYDIMSIPTWIILRDGVEIHRESYGNKQTLLKALNGS